VGASVDFFPARAAFPKWQEGRHPHWLFRGLLGLHIVAARRIAQQTDEWNEVLRCGQIERANAIMSAAGLEPDSFEN